MAQVFIRGFIHETDGVSAKCIRDLRDEQDELRGEIVHLRSRLELARIAYRQLMEYRRMNLLNWQMEKANEYFRRIGIALDPES